MNLRRWAITFASLGVVLLAGMLAACDQTTNGGFLGYNTTELFPEEYQTVAIDIFDNRTFYQGVEFDVTEAIAKEIELRTPYKIVSNTVADTVITGTVRAVNQQVLSRVREGAIPQEMQIIVQISYEWKDVRSGKVIRKRGNLAGSGEYIPTRGVGEPYEVGQHRAAAEIARDLVSDMRRDW